MKSTPKLSFLCQEFGVFRKGQKKTQSILNLHLSHLLLLEVLVLGLLLLVALLLVLLGLLVLGLFGCRLRQVRVQVQGGADLFPVGEAALLHAVHMADEVGARLRHVVAQGIADLLVDEVDLGEVGERHHVKLGKKEIMFTGLLGRF